MQTVSSKVRYVHSTGAWLLPGMLSVSHLCAPCLSPSRTPCLVIGGCKSSRLLHPDSYFRFQKKTEISPCWSCICACEADSSKTTMLRFHCCVPLACPLLTYHRRVFSALDDHAELHLALLEGIKDRYETPFFNALVAYSRRYKPLACTCKCCLCASCSPPLKLSLRGVDSVGQTRLLTSMRTTIPVITGRWVFSMPLRSRVATRCSSRTGSKTSSSSTGGTCSRPSRLPLAVRT